MMENPTVRRENHSHAKNSSEFQPLEQRTISTFVKPDNAISDRSTTRQASDEIEPFIARKKRTVRHKRFPSSDLLGMNENHHRMKHNQRSMDNILLEQKSHAGNDREELSCLNFARNLNLL